MSLDDLVDLTITVQSKAPTKAGFGTPLIAAYHTAWVSDRVREYAKADDLLSDGFTTSHHVYKIAQAVKSQGPSPRRFKVGRLANAYTQVVHLTPTVTTQGAVYSWTIAGNSGSYTVPGAATVQSICEAIQPLIDAYSQVSATEDNTKVVVTAGTPGVVHDYEVSSNLNVFDATADAGIAADLAAIAAEDADWYGLLLDTNSEANVLAAAAWVETQRKIMVVQSADAGVIDSGVTTDVASDLKASSYARTGGIWHNRIGGTAWAAAAWLAGRLTTTPGSDTWAYKTLAGVPVTRLSAGAESALATKNFTSYTTIGGLSLTFEGKTAAGDYFDTARGVDWLYARIQERVLYVLANNPKVPYTNPGIAMMTGAIQAVLNQGVENGFLAADPAPSVTAPLAQEVDPTDRIARLLPDIEFAAQLAGAVHRLVIAGTVSV